MINTDGEEETGKSRMGRGHWDIWRLPSRIELWLNLKLTRLLSCVVESDSRFDFTRLALLNRGSSLRQRGRNTRIGFSVLNHIYYSYHLTGNTNWNIRIFAEVCAWQTFGWSVQGESQSGSDQIKVAVPLKSTKTRIKRNNVGRYLTLKMEQSGQRECENY